MGDRFQETVSYRLIDRTEPSWPHKSSFVAHPALPSKSTWRD
jgi:hypothetical protein